MSILFNMVTGLLSLMIPAAGSLLVSTIMVLPASIALKLGEELPWGHADFGHHWFYQGCLIGLILSYIADTPKRVPVLRFYLWHCSCL